MNERCGGRVDSFNFKPLLDQVGNEGVYGGSGGCTMDLFMILTLEEEACVFDAELQ